MKRRAILGAAFNVLLGACLAAAQSTWHVSTMGNDTNPCTLSNPCATIARASTLALPGDIVLVEAGTYYGSFQTRASGRSSAYITYRSETPWGAMLVQGRSGSVWGNYGNYVVINGFEIVGNPSSVGVNGIYTAGQYTTISHNKVHGILPNTCTGIGGSGIQLDSAHDEVIANYVYQIGPQPGSPRYPCSYVHGIYFLKPYGLAAENIVFQASGYGIHEWHQASDSDAVNNTVFNNGYGGILVGNDGSEWPAQNNNSFTDNNLVYGNGKYGIHECCTMRFTGACNVFNNNLLYDNPTHIKLQTGTQNSAPIADPLFTHYTSDANGDYHLQSTSPAIGKGLTSDRNSCGRSVKFPPVDFSGNPRPKPRGTAFDIGAYQSE